MRPSRRYASLGAARREIYGGAETPLTMAVQNLVRDVIGRLPAHGTPFVVAFSGPDCARAMRIAALGFGRIGAQVHIEDGLAARSAFDRIDFIFVEQSHERAALADVSVEVHAEGTTPTRPGSVGFAPPMAEAPALALISA